MANLHRMRPAQDRALRILDAHNGPVVFDPLPSTVDRAAVERSARIAARVILSDHEVRVWLESNESSQHADILADLVPARAAAVLTEPPVDDGRQINPDAQVREAFAGTAARSGSGSVDDDKPDMDDRLEDLHQLLTLAHQAQHL